MKMELITARLLITVFLLSQLPAWGVDRQTKISADICKLESDLDRAILALDAKFLTALFADEYQPQISLEERPTEARTRVFCFTKVLAAATNTRLSR